MPRPTLSRRVEELEDRSTPAVAYALQTNALIAFDTANPSAALTALPVQNIVAGDQLVGIDVRPQNGQLYGLGYNGGAGTVRLYAISPRTGSATALGTPIGGITATTNFGFDYNPAVDRIRVVTEAGQNFRLNPNTGALVLFDTPINAGTVLSASAYTNNQPNVQVTTLYGLNPVNDTLVIQSSPNGGTTTNVAPITLNGAALDFTAANGFDIPAGVNVLANNAAVATGSAFAALTVGGVTRLYSINLVNGAATALGTIGAGGGGVQGLAISNDLGGPPGIGLSADGTQILRSTGGTVTAAAISGVTAGQQLVGLDYRPATGQLYAIGVPTAGGSPTGTLYRIDPQASFTTATATAVGNFSLTAGNLPVPSVGYGFDFNPVPGLIRVVTGDGLNFRLNADTGALAGQDANINGGATAATAAAYTNSFGGTAVTTLYTIDSVGKTLSIQNPPNAGTQTMTRQITLNGAVLNFTAVNGFDIPAGVTVAASNGVAAGRGFAVLTVGGVTNVYSIDLTTAAATLILANQQASVGATLGDAPAGAVGFTFPPGAATRFVGGQTATVDLVRTGGTIGNFTVTVSVVGGNAVAGVDYVGLPTTVTFADGQTTARVTFTVPAGAAPGGDRTIVLGLSGPTNGAVLSTGTTASLTLAPRVGPTRQFAAGQDVGGGTVNVYNPDNTQAYSIQPFGGFAGGVRTAMADVNGDGVADLIIGTGPGVPNRVRVLNGVDRAQIADFSPFELSFTGGVYVAGGDVTGDGRAEVIVTPDQTGGPRVVVYQLQGTALNSVASFFGITDDPNFRGGVRAAVADINGDGFGDVIVAAGFGGGPRVAIFNGRTVVGTGAAPVKLLPDFLAFADTLRNGVFVAGGDVNGDGFGDIVTGGGPGGGPRVQIISGLVALNTGSISVVPDANPANLVIANFFAGDQANRGGIRVTTKDLDGDVFADVVTGSGEGAGSQVTTYLGTALRNGTATPVNPFNAFPGFTGGVFVG